MRGPNKHWRVVLRARLREYGYPEDVITRVMYRRHRQELKADRLQATA